MASFYKEQRRKLNILMDNEGQPVGGKWSFDEDNRKRLPKKIVIPKPIVHSFPDEEMRNAKKIITTNFSSSVGSFKNFNYPISRSQALSSLEIFLKIAPHYLVTTDTISQTKK